MTTARAIVEVVAPTALCWCVALLVQSAPVAAQPFLTSEIGAYPAGFVGKAGAGWSSPRWSWAVLGGYNATNRRDWGEHDNEEGGGPGVGFRVARGAAEGGGLYGEARLDVWFLDIDWAEAGTTPRTGVSEVRVIQPMMGGGYQWRPAWGNLRVGAAVGWEVNTGLKGEAVGEGPVLVGGVQLDLVRHP